MELRPLFEIDDLDTLELVNDPFRMRILTSLAAEPLAARALAERLGVPVTRLYYHLDLLTQRGLIEVVGRRKVGAMTQRVYRAVAESYQASAELVDAIGHNQLAASAVVGSLLEGARVDAESSLARGAGGERGDHVALGRFFVELTPERFEHWSNELGKLVAAMAHDRSSGESDQAADLYTFTMVFAPASATRKQSER